jgi:hypothetical protein
MTMPASGIRKSPREWLTTEDAALTRRRCVRRFQTGPTARFGGI